MEHSSLDVSANYRDCFDGTFFYQNDEKKPKDSSGRVKQHFKELFKESVVVPNWNNSFLSACEYGDVKTVKRLFDKDCVVQNEEGLKRACWNGHEKVMRVLLQNKQIKPDVNYLFGVACQLDYLNIIKLFLKDEDWKEQLTQSLQFERACLRGNFSKNEEK